MQIGTGLFTGQRLPTDNRSMEEIYSEMIELVECADDVGLDSVWASEHHFAEDGYMPGITTTLGAFASVTDQIQIGSSMILAPLHHPVRIAEDAATLSLVSNGRFTLGLANGYRDIEFRNFGVAKNSRAQRTEEAVKLCKRAWEPGPLEYDPLFTETPPDTLVTPKPDTNPPIVMGGMAKSAIRRAALLGDGWVAPELLSLDELHKRKRYIERVREVEKRNNEFTTYIHKYCFVSDSEEDVLDQIKNSLYFVEGQYEKWYFGKEENDISEELKEDIKNFGLFGTPEEVAEDLAMYRDELGDDIHVMLRTYHPGIETEKLRRSIELIGDEVKPAFK